MATAREQRFAPFRVSIAPDWSAICHDFGLATDAEWSAIHEKIDPESEIYNVIWNGLNYTTLTQHLFYSHDKKAFFTELYLEEEIAELKQELLLAAPKFYVLRTTIPKEPVMIRFGIKRGISFADPAVSPDDLFVVLCRLPEIVFSRCAYDLEIDRKTKGHLTGWTLDGDVIDHKYVRVYCRAI